MAVRQMHVPTLMEVQVGLDVYRPSAMVQVYDPGRKLWLDREGCIIMRYERSNAEIGRVGFGGGIRRCL